MQSLLLCLTTLLCLAVTNNWSQYCNGNFLDAILSPYLAQLDLQDQYMQEVASCGRTIDRALQIKPPEITLTTTILSAHLNPDAMNVLAKNDNENVNVLERKADKTEKNKTDGANAINGFENKKPIEATLPEISRLTILHHYGVDETETWKGLSLDELADKFVVKKDHIKDAGLFVTLIKNGDTRACWGSINATQKNLVRATVFTTEDALIKDYRYTRIKKSEINQLIPQVTVVKRIVPINSIVAMKPLKQGLMVRAGGKGAVLLPGEASDPHYQLVKTKLKAGIPMSQPCQLYKIEADVYR